MPSRQLVRERGETLPVAEMHPIEAVRGFPQELRKLAHGRGPARRRFRNHIAVLAFYTFAIWILCTIAMYFFEHHARATARRGDQGQGVPVRGQLLADRVQRPDSGAGQLGDAGQVGHQRDRAAPADR